MEDCYHWCLSLRSYLFQMAIEMGPGEMQSKLLDAYEELSRLMTEIHE